MAAEGEMMNIEPRPTLSHRRIAANRRNALKSTGPRTADGKRRSSLNALKQGLGAESFHEVMRSLGENPREFEQLHQDLIGSCQPANALEAKLVEDLARLWWKKARAERAQAGVQIQQVDRLQVQRLREFHEINRLSSDQSRDELAQVGLLHGKNCKGKFQGILDVLDMLIAQVERGKGYEDAEGGLQGIYGPKPTLRGSLILKYLRLLNEGQEYSEDESPGPGGAEPLGNAGANRERGFPIRAALVQWLVEERQEVAEEYELFLREHVEISPAARDACLAPTDVRWTWILRMDNYLDRQIERKMRMLLKLQSLCMKPIAGRRCAERKRQTCPNAQEKKILKTQKRSH